MGNGLILRPDDLVVLGVSWSGMRIITGAAGEPDQLEAIADRATVTLTLPPQHLAEEPVDWGWWGPIWKPLGGQAPIGTQIAVMSDSWQSMDVFFVGDDGVAWRDHWRTEAPWGSGWQSDHDGRLTPIDGATFVTGASIVTIAFADMVLVYAIEVTGRLCQLRYADGVWGGWEPVEGDPATAIQFQPNRQVEVAYAAGAQNVFIIGPGNVMFRWRPDAAVIHTGREFQMDSPMKALNFVSFAVVVTSQSDGQVAFDSWDASGWLGVDLFPQPPGANFGPHNSFDGNNYESTSVQLFAIDDNGRLWSMETRFTDPGWTDAKWTDLGVGFPGGGRVALSPGAVELGLRAPHFFPWLVVSGSDGVILATFITTVGGVQTNGWQELGDWFAPGGFVTAITRGDAVELFAVGTDKMVYTTGRTDGQWRSQTAGWTPVRRIGAAESRLAGPCKFTYQLRQGRRVPLTAEGVLEMAGNLHVGSVIDDGPVPDGVSFVEIPWGLISAVSTPQFGSSGLGHAIAPVVQRGSVELWRTRLMADHLLPFAVRGDNDPGAGFRPPLNEQQRKLILGDTEPALFEAPRTVMSALGADFVAHAVRPEIEWEHLAVGGRDVKVRTVERGALYPFGYQATYVEHTLRRFDPRSSSSVAVLHRQGTLYIREPRVAFDVTSDTAEGRQFPFTAVDLITTTVTHLDPPQWESDSLFWPRHDGELVEFELRMWTGNQAVLARGPLLFVRQASRTESDRLPAERADIDVDVADLAKAAYARAEAGVTLAGASIPLAAGKVFEVHELRLTGVLAGGSTTGLLPQIEAARLALPAVRQFTNAAVSAATGVVSDTVSRLFAFGARYRDLGSTDVLFKMLGTESPLGINFAGSGIGPAALVTPSFVADAIDGNGSPIKAALAVAGAHFDPTKFFAPDAKLLGIVSLADVLKQFTGPNVPPVLKSNATTPLSVTMTWDAKLGAVGPFKPLAPARDATLHVEVKSVVGVNASLPGLAALGPPASGVSADISAPEVTTNGELANFSLNLAGAIVVGFKSLKFAMLPGQKPSLAISGVQFAFAGDLQFLEVLRKVANELGHEIPSAVDVTPDHISASHDIAVASLSIPVGTINVSISNLVFHGSVTLPFDGPIALDVGFGSRAHPFLLGVWILGGGGHLELKMRNGELVEVNGSAEIGGLWVLDWGIVVGEVHALLGVEFTLANGKVKLEGYLRVGGSVSVLGLISVSIELRASLTVEASPFRVFATASIALDVDLFLISTSVHLDKTVQVYPKLSTLTDAPLEFDSERRDPGAEGQPIEPAAAHDAWIAFRKAFEPV